MNYPEIEDGIPFADFSPTFVDLKERIDAAFKSLTEVTDDVPVSDEDIAQARQLFTGSAKPTDVTLSAPGTVVHLKAILDQYDKVVVQSAAQIRTYVTNKLIEDSTHADPRVRLRCYELLGKISDVGLFTDKTEVTMRHRPTEELEHLLRERLMRTINADDEPAPVVLPAPDEILGDVDEFGG
jgi:hypothetical protein